mgnify:FL=1
MKIRSTSKQSGDMDTKSRDKRADFSAFQFRVMVRFCGAALIATVVVIALYLFLWKRRGGDLVVWLMERWLDVTHEEAFYLYHDYFRSYKEIFFGVAIVLVFLLMLWYLFRWMTRYFREIDQGIDSLLSEQAEQIRLSAEMEPFERKLNSVRSILDQRERAARSAEQRKNELVLYLAHDIRTPLTSVLGYLDLLEEMPELPAEERAKYVHISLEKARRLEKMISEFFEITRYNTQQIAIDPKPVDLYYLLVQVIDEHIPLFTEHGNYVTLRAQEPLQVWGDGEKLARVFNNLLKNAAAYSDPGTEVIVSTEAGKEAVSVRVTSTGKMIPADKLDALFEKFYRLDDARTSHTGGTGLGLAIAKEIVALHDGTILAESENGKTTFTVQLPVREKT